jgi:hypothetical protein
MKSMFLLFNSLEKIKKFMDIITNFEGEKVDLISDGYKVNAKSPSALFALDLSKEIELVVYDDNLFESLKIELAELVIKQTE